MASKPLLVVLLAFIALTSAAKIFITPSGTDSPGCGGTAETACATLAYAIGESAANDIVYLYPGSYDSSGMSTMISHNLTIAAAVVGEGPPIVDFGVSVFREFEEL